MRIGINMFGDEDPKGKTYQTQAALDAANMEAKRFALAKGLQIGQNAHVGRKVGDPVVPYIDARTGKDITGVPNQAMLPYNTITDIRKIPYYVTDKDIQYDPQTNLPFYIDQQTGDPQPIHPDIARSSRFNPNRGQYDKSIAKK